MACGPHTLREEEDKLFTLVQAIITPTNPNLFPTKFLVGDAAVAVAGDSPAAILPDLLPRRRPPPPLLPAPPPPPRGKDPTFPVEGARRRQASQEAAIVWVLPKLGHQEDVCTGAALLHHADIRRPGRWDHRRRVGGAGMLSLLGEEGSSVHCVRYSECSFFLFSFKKKIYLLCESENGSCFLD